MAKVFLRAYNRDIEAMIDRGQLDEAVAHCHHILKTFPKHLETYRLLGKAYLEAKRYGDAVDIFSRILAAVPNDFVAHVGMSIIRDEENKLDDAIWHMERAFETQPSNSAIQSELQRLYGRRDGVQPPRIRMTRGALAHMYVQGELYPQAISEIKSVLKEDPGRSDMQALLARAHYKSGARNDAVDAALALLQRLPYALDANRVLVEVLSGDRNDAAQSYRQRVVELDPYAAQVTGNIFLANEVSDAAVALERLDWNGQPVGMQSDWRETQAISLESPSSRNEQPDWLKNPFGETNTPPPAQPTSALAFDDPAATPAQPADEIPDFLKAAGWGQSTGAFDESKSMFANEEQPASSAEPIAQADLPDWVKAMKPPEPEPAAPTEEEELPDWINQIGTGALAASAADQPEQASQAAGSDDQPDWLKGFGESEQPVAGTDQPDWLKGFGSESDVTPQVAQSDTPDWLKGLGSEPESASQADLSWLDAPQSETTPQPAQTDTPDWLKGIGSEPESTSQADLSWLDAPQAEPETTPQPAQTDTPDWLKGIGSEPEPAATSSDDDTDWLKQFGTQADSVASGDASDDLDFLNQLTPEPVSSTPEESAPSAVKADDLGTSEQERDDAFAWLENLAAKQGATEGLLTKPEERLEEEPKWVKQAKAGPGETPIVAESKPTESLGASEQERDDAFAWLENLAAKQGATEGLLTQPDERLEEEPEWVKQAKEMTSVETPAPVEIPAVEPASTLEEPASVLQESDDSLAWLENLADKQETEEAVSVQTTEPQAESLPDWLEEAESVASEPPASTPPAAVEELGKSEQERDDSFAWLESLAAKQGASEGLLTKPEERLEEEPEWVKQAKGLTGAPASTQPAANLEELGKSEQERDDSFAWLESLAAKQGASEGLLTKPEERLEEEPEWVRQAKDLQQQPAPTPPTEPVMEQPPAASDDTGVWLRSLEEEKPSEPGPGADETSIWFRKLEQSESETVQAALESADAEMPAWMKNIEEEAPAEPVASVEEPVETSTPAEDAGIPNWLSELDQEEEQPTAVSADDDLPAWMQNIDEKESTTAAPTLAPQETESQPQPTTAEPSDVPSWLSELEKEEETPVTAPSDAEDLPAWLRGDDAISGTPEPTHAEDWKPIESKEPEITYSPAPAQPEQPRIIYSPPLAEEPAPQPEPEAPTPVADIQEPVVTEPVPVPRQDLEPEPRPAKKAPSRPQREPAAPKGVPAAAGVDAVLGSARSELTRSNIPGALESYSRLIKKGRFLDEVIYDLREALYRYPVEVSIWQSLGDAYMRANRLQDALDAYTKAEELLR